MPNQHEEEPDVNATLSRLDDEWNRIDRSPASAAALRRWSLREPDLRPSETLGSLLLRRKHQPETARGILAALARLAPSDELAARTLLQAMLPGLVRLATSALADDPLALDEVVALAWERIRTYPRTRAGSVAANVIWDVRKRYREHRSVEVPGASPVEVEAARPAPSAEEVVLETCAVDDVLAAMRAGSIGEEALALIVRTRLEEVPLEVVAAEQRFTARRANCIRWRAERRLRPLLAEAG